MRLVAVGLSHHRAAFGLLGRVALGENETRCLLQNLVAAGAREAAAISTCNRTELYLAGTDAAGLTALAVHEFSELVDVSPDELEPVLYRLADATAALHLNRVASGVDSLVPGEAQVLGQVRAALALASSEGTAGPMLSRAFQRALETGKRARSETGISVGNASIASVAASLADHALGGLSGRSALVVGAGRTSELAALNLIGRGLRRLSVANRTYQSACTLAGRLGGSAVHFEDVAGSLRDVDVVVSSTSAPHAVLRADMVEPALSGRTSPLVFLDLAVPADVEPAVALLAGCEVHGLDDLAAEIARTVAFRREEAAVAETICADAAEDFRLWQAERTVGPAIGRLRARAESVRAAEVARLSVGLDDGERARFERLSRQLVCKLLHNPTVRLRDSANGPDGVQYA
ncbi:MAG: glutamyl-tRNA reductase, partial [Gaiellales bacterium]